MIVRLGQVGFLDDKGDQLFEVGKVPLFPAGNMLNYSSPGSRQGRNFMGFEPDSYNESMGAILEHALVPKGITK